MINYAGREVYGIISEECSRFYPGATVRVLKYLEDTDSYQVKNPDSDYTCIVSAKDIEILGSVEAKCNG